MSDIRESGFQSMPRPFDLLSWVLCNIVNNVSFAGYSSNGKTLDNVTVNDSLGREYAQFNFNRPDQQTVVLYRDHQSELVLEQRPVRPLRRSTDSVIQKGEPK